MEVILIDLFTLYYVITLAITLAIELITSYFSKFCRNGEIERQWVNSAARLKILQPVENC